MKTLNSKTFQLEVTDDLLVRDLKRMVAKSAQAEGKFVRLIHQGKMLSDETAPLSKYKLKNEDYLHCAISAIAPRQTKPVDLVRTRSRDTPVGVSGGTLTLL